jgi:hypothetical protein
MATDLSIVENVQIGSEAQTTSYPIGTAGSYPGKRKRLDFEIDYSPNEFRNK